MAFSATAGRRASGATSHGWFWASITSRITVARLWLGTKVGVGTCFLVGSGASTGFVAELAAARSLATE